MTGSPHQHRLEVKIDVTVQLCQFGVSEFTLDN